MDGVRSLLLTGILLSVASTALGGYCAAYCDLDGYYKNGFYCLTSSNIYCCGNDVIRYCCANATQDITGGYRDVYFCDNSSWWIFNWHVVTGVLTTSLVVLFCSACCCKCCYQFHNRTGRRRQQDDIHVISDSLDENGTPVQPSVFNPDSPHAFVPPDYNSLPKDPPKYQDLYTHQAYGNVNQAYAASEANPTEMTSMVAAPACEAAGNASVIAGVHGQVEDNTARDESNQGDLPEDPPPSYTESQAVCPPSAGDQGDTVVVMQNETVTEA